MGKSALAQTCAEKIEASGQLVATFFFYRPSGWNDPQKFIPTIAYQLTTKYSAYRDLLDAIILRDPLVLETSIDVQFRELLVKPLHELSAKGQAVGTDTIIIIDGLDECKTTTAQTAIMELVTTSIHDQTTPFLWAFFSRPEPHIVSAFSSELAMKVSWQLTLPVSRDADSDIEAYLQDGFRMIRAKYGLPSVMAWPSMDDIRRLVDQSSGLFVYAATIIRYIGQDSCTSGPEERLQSVLKLGRERVGSDGNPLSALDRFYTLTMEQVPKEVLANTLSLLCIHLNHASKISHYCSMLNISLMAFHAATKNLHSVLDITKSQSGVPVDFSFYHKSFADFLSTTARSGLKYCVNVQDNLQKCFDASINFLYNNPAATDRMMTLNDHLSPLFVYSDNILAWPDPDSSASTTHQLALQILFTFAVRHEVDVRENILHQFSQINWSHLSFINTRFIQSEDIEAFVVKVCCVT